jgi:hypothetical protein
MPDGLHPEPTLQATALRYAAGDLSAAEAAAFEARLAGDQEARDALAEAVRLSAAALGQPAPAPHRSFRAAAWERLTGWCPGWLARRAYRGHPLAWAGVGALAVAACIAIGFSLGEPEAAPAASPVAASPARPAAAPAPRPGPVAAAPAPTPQEAELLAAPAECGDGGHSVAEIWAQLSGTESVEKAHDEELRWRQKLRDAGLLAGRPGPGTTATDSREE